VYATTTVIDALAAVDLDFAFVDASTYARLLQIPICWRPVCDLNYFTADSKGAAAVQSQYQVQNQHKPKLFPTMALLLQIMVVNNHR